MPDNLNLKLFITAAFLSSGTFLFCQQITIINESTGDPVENVALFNQDKTISAISDYYGKADIQEFGEKDSIFFQHPSFETVSRSKHELFYGNRLVGLKKRVIMMDEFVISAHKDHEKKSEIPYKIDILEEKQIQSSVYQTSADILTETGNVMIQKSQGGGGSPILRGFEANKILLVVDGVRMNNAIYRTGHLQNAITIDPNILERVEVLFGPSSIIYGSDALGGVIHYYTRDPEFSQNKVQFYSQLSSANKGKIFHADANMGWEKTASILSFTYSGFGNIATGRNRKDFYGDWGLQKHFVDRIGGMDSTLSNNQPHVQKNTAYRQYDLMSKTKYSPDNLLDLYLNLQFSTSSDIDRFDQLNDYSGADLSYAEWYYGPQNRFLGSVQAVNKNYNRIFTNMTTTLAYQHIDEDRFTRKFRVDDRLSQKESVNVFSFNTDFVKLFENDKKLHYGIEYTRNWVSSVAEYENILSGQTSPALTRYPGGGTKTNSISAYSHYKMKINPMFLLDAGLRYHYGWLHSYFTDSFFPIQEIKIADGSLTGSLSLIIHPEETWQYNLILSTGFRNPNVDDYGKVRAKSGLITVPNADLKSEYSYNIEVSTVKTFPGVLSIGGSFFFTYLNNAIVRTNYSINGSDSLLYDGDYYRIITNSNASLATIYGISMEMKSNLNSPLEFKGTLNFMNGRDVTDNQPLAHIPPVFGRLSSAYSHKKFFSEFYFLYSGRKYWDDMSPLGEDNEVESVDGYGFPAWQTFNIRSVCQLNENISLQLALENIFDKFYKSFASGVAAPGRNLIFTFRVVI